MSTYTIGGFTRTRTTNQTDVELVQDDGETKPSQVSNQYWLFETSSFEMASPNNGKWMLFYFNRDIDAAWVKAKNSMRKGLLTGIGAMKVSTARENARVSDANSQVIIFYCGPPEDEASVIRYGENLVAVMNYKSLNSNPFVYYKSDAQTADGTRATGQTKNHLYKIRVPTGGSNFSLDTSNHNVASRNGKRRLSDDDDEDEIEETRKRLIRLSPSRSLPSAQSDVGLPTGSSALVGAPTTAPTTAPAASPISPSSETTRIKFRLENVPNASPTIVASFNVRQRLAELVGFLASHVPVSSMQSGRWTLIETFPTRELTNHSMTIEEAGLCNAVVIARWS